MTTSDPKPVQETTRASLELLYHISRELTTALDLRAVLQRVVFLSMKTIGAISGSIIVLDDAGHPMESAIITGAQVHDQTTQRLRATLERGLAGWVVRNRQSVLVPDTSQDERWMPRQYEVDERAGPKSAVSAPLWARERLVGVMTLVHPQPGHFTQEHLTLVQAIADQAGVAVLNARLYAESQQRERVMTALAESAVAITGSLNLEDVLARIMAQVSHAFRVQGVSLALVEADETRLVFRSALGWTIEADTPRPQLGQGLMGRVADEGQGLVIPDLRKAPGFEGQVERRGEIELRAVACAPVRYRGQVIGVLEIFNPTEGTLDDEALRVLTGIGSLAGTAIRHAQLFERLQAAHQSYRDLFEDSIDALVITDWEGRITQANRQAARMTNFEKEALRRRNILQIHTVDEEAVGAKFEALRTGKTVSYESLMRARERPDVPVQVHVRQVDIEGVAHLQWTMRDITERKNLDTLREDLTSMIYHDLRSPLANVVSSLDVLDNMFSDETDPALRSLLGIAMRSVERIQRLTNSLLDINRLEAGQPVVNRRPTTASSLISDAIETVMPVARNKEQTLVRQVAAGLPQVMIDSEMLRRVLTNLLENAIKYTPNGGKIEVGARPEGAWMQIWVQDNGPGIPAGEHERIFDKYTRLNARDYPKGFGLGLAYCRLAVQGHGGRIWVESERGRGARFIFTLPLAQDQP
jgi:PAS domain S-box-containing protein